MRPRPNGKMPHGIFSTPCWLLVRLYQLTISPIINLLPDAGCRFYPTCSEYTMQAISRHGAFKGIILGACRILRCNPLCEGGLDYVPEKFSWKRLFKQNKVDESDSVDN